MSAEIVKSIAINQREKKVYITSCCTNDHPQKDRRSEYESLSALLENDNYKELAVDIMKMYENGLFHCGSSNDYSDALKFGFNGEYYGGSSGKMWMWKDGRRWDDPKPSDDEFYNAYLAFKNQEKGKYVVSFIALDGTQKAKVYVKNIHKSRRGYFLGACENTDEAKSFKYYSKAKDYVSKFKELEFTIENLDKGE